MTLLLLTLLACDGPPPPPAHTERLVGATPEVPAPAGDGKVGGTIYVPVYSSVFIRDGNQTFDLSVTVSVRNADPERPIALRTLRFHDREGKLIHSYVDQIQMLGPLASAETLVAESDTRAGVGGSFVFEWEAPAGTADPVVEAVMIGASSQQGISFLSQGRVVRRTGAGTP